MWPIYDLKQISQNMTADAKRVCTLFCNIVASNCSAKLQTWTFTAISGFTPVNTATLNHEWAETSNNSRQSWNSGPANEAPRVSETQALARCWKTW